MRTARAIFLNGCRRIERSPNQNRVVAWIFWIVAAIVAAHVLTAFALGRFTIGGR
jgi:hypothetical protein